MKSSLKKRKRSQCKVCSLSPSLLHTYYPRIHECDLTSYIVNLHLALVRKQCRKPSVIFIFRNPLLEFQKRADLEPSEAAIWILSGIASGKTRIVVGYDGLFLDLATRFWPTAMYWVESALGRCVQEKVCFYTVQRRERLTVPFFACICHSTVC